MRRSSVVIRIALGSTALGVGLLGVAVTAGDAEARLDLYVDKSAQQMSVIQNGALLYVWPISTGHDRHSTPSGVYTPERLERSWFSKAYYNAPMPHAIFFHNGYAIHGSDDISKLGGPASLGCVRLHPRNAALLFSMVQRAGASNTAIVIGGDVRRPSLLYRNFDDQARLARLRDDGMAHGAYPPAPVMPPPRARADPYVDSASAYPPGPPPPPQFGSRMSPYDPAPPVDRRGAYPAGRDALNYYEPDRYSDDDGRSMSRGPHVGPYGDGDGHYVDGRDGPRDPRLPPDYRADPQVYGRTAPQSPRMPADYNIDPYVDARGVPYSPAMPPYYPPDRRADARGVYPQPEPSPRPPYNAVDRSADGPARQHGDPLTMRGNYPAPRLPAPRPDGTEWTLHSGARPMTAGAAGTNPKLEAGPEPRSRPGRFADAPPARRLTAGEAAKASGPPIPVPAAPAPQPATVASPLARAEPPQERPQPEVGYRVLPRSYWAGASWRWRIKRDEDGFPRDTQ